MRSYFFPIIFLSSLYSYGQVVSIDPIFANQDDTVTIVFDASLGNGALSNISPVYAHTGVITNLSANPTAWRYVQGNWGTADPQVLMTFLGNNKHEIKYHINSFYGVPQGEMVSDLAFVFRNADGSVVGRASDGSDIFVPIYSAQFAAAITNPSEDFLVVALSDTINLAANSSDSAKIELFHDGISIALDSGIKGISADIVVASYGIGKFWITMVAENDTATIIDSIYYIVPGPVNFQNPPAGTDHGINIIDTNTIVLSLLAPRKDYIYALGDFSAWELDPKYFMNRSLDSMTYWVELDSLDPNIEYRFQYQIENEMRVAEIYSEKILDPWNDSGIGPDRYPGLIPYPNGKTTEPVSVFQIVEQEYQWDPSINYQKPDKKKLFIYETLVRDFTSRQDFRTIKDTLDYLEKLGINAIELMPINEFEGNESWGYNPSFYFAPDKYYGPKDSLKALVEECHRRGIAVLLDMVLNQSFGQSPMVRMYFDAAAGQWGQPTAENPWFREIPAHPFNVGYDFDHESPFTEYFVDRVLAHWVNEYRIDGYRMDLSKGFTNFFSGNNVGLWGQYDQSRVNIWNRIGNQIWSVDSTTIMILEHFADNSEETVLSDMGFLLWGNCNFEYNEASMGYPSDLRCASWKNRNWNDPNLIGYMESHDEERMMFKNLQYGNSSGNYDITNLATALKRIELAVNFFLTIPGPKMMWQFGELGYDFSINRCTDGTIDPSCRLSNKPVRWDYFDVGGRKRLYSVFSSLMRLRDNYDVFHTNNFNLSVTSSLKSIQLDGVNMDVQVIGNFGVTSQTMTVNFLHFGTWYEYYGGDSLDVVGSMGIPLAPGEYRLYTDQKLPLPILLSMDEDLGESSISDFRLSPNPANSYVDIEFNPDKSDLELSILDLNGRLFYSRSIPAGERKVEIQFSSFSALPNPGVYVLKVISDEKSSSAKLLISK
jgi:Alpha amylase, catalytic domain/Secretion system C-terminal sorting domain